MTATNTAETTALALSSASAGALLLDTSSMERLERIADLMASGKTTVPAHLRGSKGDCFAIVLQSMQWGMNPFAVAQKTHLVNGVLGYEAQLVAAVINSSGAVLDRFHFEWFGPWEKIIGRFKEVESKTKKDDNGHPKRYIVPAWEQKDEHGLGVKVWATLKGEKEPRMLELLLTQARTRNSTLWTEDPKQQLAYLAQKRWSRLYAPDVIMGVYTPDELAEPDERFMGIVGADGAAAAPAAPVTYPQADFEKNLPAWLEVIKKGRKNADQIIAMAETKFPLTEDQKAKVRAGDKQAPVDLEAKPAATAATAPGPDAAAPAPTEAPAVTYAQVADKLQAAKTGDELALAADLIKSVADEKQRDELNAMFDKRQAELG